MSKVWFITGASKGFGRSWTEAALQRGDRVAATARDASTLDALVEQYGDAVLPCASTSPTNPASRRRSRRPTTTSAASTWSSTTPATATSE